MKRILQDNGHWFILLGVTDLAFIFLVWLLSPTALPGAALFILLFTTFVFATGCFLEKRRNRQRRRAVLSFLKQPGEQTFQDLSAVEDPAWHPVADALYRRLSDQAARITDQQLALQTYREYIEAWTHEIKGPLSLLTLVLANRREEMSPYVHRRIEYAGQQIYASVQMILYYARLNAAHVDHPFRATDLTACVAEAIEAPAFLAEEKGVRFQVECEPLEVISDPKLVSFIVAQLVGNAVKYAPPETGVVRVEVSPAGEDVRLRVEDNGPGVPEEDLPFIFDKGFRQPAGSPEGDRHGAVFSEKLCRTVGHSSDRKKSHEGRMRF